MTESSVSTSVAVHVDDNIYLIGYLTRQIVGDKLPSNRQVLSVLFYNLRKVKLNLHDSARLVIKEAKVFWLKARIPIREQQHSVTKLQKLYNTWRDLQKLSKRTTEKQKKKVVDFADQLDDLFDIAHSNALEIICNEEDKMFLQSQRQKGRPGCMPGTNRNLVLQKKQTEEKRQKSEERKKREYAEIDKAGKSSQPKSIIITSSSEEDVSELAEEYKPTISCAPPSQVRRKRGSLQFITEKILSVLDKCKISDRDAVHLIIATAEALGCDTTKLIINRSSLRRLRKQFREDKMKEIQEKFHLMDKDLPSLVVHWDTKLLPEISEHTKVDRLPVLVSFEGRTQLLGVPKLEAGTGKYQAEAVFQTLSEWGITDKVQAMCCDTTASNTGRIKGTCALLEQSMERDLLYLPCRRHILEVVVKSVFEMKLKLPTSGPDVPIFKRFKEGWPKIDKTKYEIGVKDPFLKEAVQNIRDRVVNFCVKCLQDQKCRDDYREFLEPTIIFLGEIPPRGLSFRYPGAFHHARWMSKVIYCLKIFLFRNQFPLTSGEVSGIRDICLFLIHSYIEAWFRCPFTVEAPYNDYIFLKNLANYPDEAISRTALNKFCGHLWYLCPELIAIAFFDDRLPKETKKKMVQAMKITDELEDINNKRVLVRPTDVKDFIKTDISQFVNPHTLNFFTRFNLSTEFLNIDPDYWEGREDYQNGLKIIKLLPVINDTAERSIKLISEYSNILTKDENQKQFLLQVVNDYRAKYPDCKKETLQDA